MKTKNDRKVTKLKNTEKDTKTTIPSNQKKKLKSSYK